MKFKIIILMILAELFFIDLSLGDITWQLTDITKVSGKTIITRQSIYITENIFSIETEDGMRMILNISADTLTIIDNNQKTFSTTSINEMEEKAANLELETEKMIEEALQNIPEEQRGLYKEMLKQQLATADSSEKTAPDWEKSNPPVKP